MDLATPNSGGRWGVPPARAKRWSAPRDSALLALFTLIHSLCSGAFGAETDFLAFFTANYHAAQARHQKQPVDDEASWQFGRACFDLAEFATNSTQRADLANEGITACEQTLARASNSAAAHYYLGMNYGQLARTRGLGALKLIKYIQREFSSARELDEKFDHAGPDRNLGLLYLDAPSIGSVGSRSRARQHLQRAVELAPDYPDNRLSLIEAYLKWNDRNGAKREFKPLDEHWPDAHKQYSGPAWASSWADWEPRFKQVKKKIEEPLKALESPRNTP